MNADGGVLTPQQYLGLKDITDGSSNTLAVSECSDFVWDTATPPHKTQQINNWPHGFLMGNENPGTVEQANAWGWGPLDRHFNITTIMYPPNSVNIGLNGVGQNDGPNNGIYSAHPGGVNGLRADASVSFISSTINMYVLRLFANRDDGQPLPSM
jgi:hypothetical protein